MLFCCVFALINSVLLNLLCVLIMATFVEVENLQRDIFFEEQKDDVFVPLTRHIREVIKASSPRKLSTSVFL